MSEHICLEDLTATAETLLRCFEQTPPKPSSVILSASEIAATIDHTLLKPEATPAMIDRLCEEGRKYRFASVCVNSLYVRQCVHALEGSGIPVCSVVGFPLGAMETRAKAFEARSAIQDGAREIDMVLPIGLLLSGEYLRVYQDISEVVNECHAHGAICKVIIEAALLSDLEKVIACLLLKKAGADFAKTSTGFGPGGATLHDVSLMRAVVGPDLGVKAAGGIRTYEAALAMVRAGASRIGASSGVRIVQDAPR